MFVIKADGLAMSNAQYFSLMFEDPWHSRCYFYFLWPYVTTWRTLPIVKLFLLPNSGAYLYSAEGMTLISHRSQYQYSVGFCFYEKLIFPINHPPHHFEVKKCMLKFHILNEYRNRTCITNFFILNKWRYLPFLSLGPINNHK